MIKNLLLEWQLRRSGASKEEARDLVQFSRHIEYSAPEEFFPKDNIARQIGFKPTNVHMQKRVAWGSALGTWLVIAVFAQTAMPGSSLYTVKRASEEVRAQFQQDFKQEMVERRKSELNTLVSQNADENRIQEAEDNYIKTAKRAGLSPEMPSVPKASNEQTSTEGNSSPTMPVENSTPAAPLDLAPAPNVIPPKTSTTPNATDSSSPGMSNQNSSSTNIQNTPDANSGMSGTSGSGTGTSSETPASQEQPAQ